MGLHLLMFMPIGAMRPDRAGPAASAMQVRMLSAAPHESASADATPARPPSDEKTASIVAPAPVATPTESGAGRPRMDTSVLAERREEAPIPAPKKPPPSIPESQREATPENPSAVPAATQPTPPAQAAKPARSLPLAPDYLFGVRLDPGPRPLDDIDPEYPSEGELQEGKVALRLLISETGHVDNVAVVSSYPVGLFDRAAITAFANARFAPGLLLGTPTKSQITIEVHFAPFNRGSRVSGRGY